MELTQFLKLIRSHWIGVVVLTLVGGLLALGWSAIQTPVYRADATGTVAASEEVGDASTALLYNNLAKSEVKTYLQWAKTRAVANRTIKDLGIASSPEALVKRIEVENPEGTPVLRVVAEGPTPSKARDLATAWLNALASEGAAQSGGEANAVLSLNVTASAGLPGAPAFPNFKVAVALGALFGFILGVALAYIRGVLDRRIRTAEQIEYEFRVSVIGTVPVERSIADGNRLERVLSGGANEEPSYSFVREAMRELRTNLQFVNVDNPPKVIVVSSPLPGNGKSTTTANLAATIASSGRRVVVVDGDLRRPTVAKTFGLVESVGLTDVLSGQAELAEVLQPWGTGGNLFVLGAGKIPPNPSELLGSHAMRSVLEELSQHAIVLIDAPPLLPVTDAVVLAGLCDGALVVVSAGKTTVDALGKGLQNLEKARARALGVVINRVPRRGPNSSYGYGYYRTAQEEPDRGRKIFGGVRARR